MSRSSRPRFKIRIDDRKLRLLSDDGVCQTLDLGEIIKVSAFKMDLFTYDVVGLEIAFDERGGVSRWMLDEEMDGFKLCQTWLEALPGFDLEGYLGVLLTPFQTGPVVLYQRNDAG
ncbi:MAG: hypothetical protein AAF441_25065 [Pseudomonadota bacterium]